MFNYLYIRTYIAYYMISIASRNASRKRNFKSFNTKNYFKE